MVIRSGLPNGVSVGATFRVTWSWVSPKYYSLFSGKQGFLPPNVHCTLSFAVFFTVELISRILEQITVLSTRCSYIGEPF